VIDLSPLTGGSRERLLATLIEAGAEFAPRDVLVERTGVSPLRLTRILAELGEAGLPLETMPGRGHRLAWPVPPLDARSLENAVARSARWRRLVAFPAVTSTNDAAIALGEAGEPDGTVVVAEAQTRGRGRNARAWISPPGVGLWCSFLLRMPIRADRVPHVTAAAALAAVRAVREASGVSLLVKWPNDLVAASAQPNDAGEAARWSKAGGILSEGRTIGETLEFAVIGMGLNVAPLPPGAPAEVAGRATSLAALAGRPVAREVLFASLLSALEPLLSIVAREGLASLLPELRALSPLLGRQVTVDVGGRVVRGIARDLDASGALLVEVEGGRLERILAGDASLAETG